MTDTALDARFSHPDAKTATWADTQNVLERAQLSWICTVRADGRPHLTPLVAVWLDETLYFSTGPVLVSPSARPRSSRSPRGSSARPGTAWPST